MKLKYILLSIVSAVEISIFTNFIINFSKPTDNNFWILIKLYKTKTNSIDIFPKLLFMVQAYYSRWKKIEKLRHIILILETTQKSSD